MPNKEIKTSTKEKNNKFNKPETIEGSDMKKAKRKLPIRAY